MKRRKILLLLAVPVGLLAALYGVSMLPSVQRAVVLRAAGRVPGLALTLDYLSAGWGGAEVRGLVAEYHGNTIRIPQLHAQYSGLTFLLRRELRVQRLAVPEFALEAVADAAPGGPVVKTADSPAAAFAGLLAPIQLPFPIAVDLAEVSGRIALSPGRMVQLAVHGRLLAPGAEAAPVVRCDWTDVDAAPGGLRELHWVGELRLRETETGVVSHLALDGVLAADAAAGSAGRGLRVTLDAGPEVVGGPVKVEASVRLPAAKPGEAPLLRVQLEQRPGDGRVTGDWNVSARRDQVAVLAPDAKWPEFNATAQGRFSCDSSSGDFATTGRATASVSQLRKVRPEFSGLDAVAATMDFAVERTGSEVKLAKFEVGVDSGSVPVLRITALQPASYRLDTGAVAIAQPENDLLRVEVGGMPLAWAQPWLPDTMLAGNLSSGECRLQGAGRGWTVETVRPFVFSGVRYVRAGRMLVEQLGGELALRATMRDDAWVVEDLNLQLRPGSLLPGGTVKLGLKAELDAAGSGSVALPLTIDCDERHSRFRLEGTWSAGSDGGVLAEVRLAGETVHLRDLSWLGAIPSAVSQARGARAPVMVGKAKPTEATNLSATKDTQPFWWGVGGRLEVDVQRIVLDADEITGVQAVVVGDAQHLALEKLAGRTNRSPLSAKFGLTFDAAKSQPYSLEGGCTFPDIDLGALLRAAAPGEEPALETVLDLAATLEGQGGNLDELLAGLRGDFVLRGGPGVLRIKDKRVEKVQALGGLVLGLLSKDKPKPAVAAGSQLLAELREFHFERFDASVLRAEDGNLQIRVLDVRSADKRLTGTGVARYVGGKPVVEYPLQLELRLGGKDNFAALLDQVSLLDGTKDELEYLRMREPFVVSGTLVKPDWKKMLLLFGAGLVFGK